MRKNLKAKFGFLLDLKRIMEFLFCGNENVHVVGNIFLIILIYNTSIFGVIFIVLFMFYFPVLTKREKNHFFKGIVG